MYVGMRQFRDTRAFVGIVAGNFQGKTPCLQVDYFFNP